MGNCLAGVFRRRKLRRHIVLILIGLDNAGKTKTVNNLVGDNDEKILPTVGFKAVNLIHKDTPVTIYDLGGGPEFRQIWPQYFSEIHGVIFVMDSSDLTRLDECRNVLEEVISHEKISGKPILILANKQDKDGALDDIDVVEKLQIEPLVNKYRCPTLVESYSASMQLTKRRKPKIDPGLKKGYQWLLNYISRRYGDINLRVQTDIHADLERRKRMLQKSSNRASQTFTAVSDEVATQTGFENPNYETLSRKSQDLDKQSGIIVVKESCNRSLNTSVTIESTESVTDNTSKPKLSPFFDKSNETSNKFNETSDKLNETSDKLNETSDKLNETADKLNDSTDKTNDSNVKSTTSGSRESKRVKLSPIAKVSRSIDFDNRPQSSPTSKRRSSSSKKSSTVTHTSQQVSPLESSTLSQRSAYASDSFSDSVRSKVAGEAVRGRTLDMRVMHRDALSDIAVLDKTSASPPARPASASQLVRRQLECHSHTRRLSLKHIHRNKTSPEKLGIFHYEPTKAAPKKVEVVVDGPATYNAQTNLVL